MKRLLASLALAFGFICLAEAQEKPADPVKASLSKARAALEAEIEKTDQSLADAYEKLMAVARKKGDKTTLDRLKPDWLAFELVGTLPKWTPSTTKQRLTSAQQNLEGAYAQAIRAYTKSGEDEKAATIQKEMSAFHKQPPAARFYSLVNDKSGLALAPSKETADRGTGLVQVKSANEPYQQWLFAPTRNPNVFMIKNRLNGLFVNLNGAHRVGLQAKLWSSDAVSHNSWSISHEGPLLRIRDANGEFFLAPKDASQDENQPIVQAEKGDGNEQFWRLVPVKSE